MGELTRYELPSVVVHPSNKYWGAEWLIHEDPTTVATLPVSPGGLVCPVGLEVDPDVAPHLLVNDVRVGKDSQLCTVGYLPASLFADATPVPLFFDRIPPGLRFSLSLTCTSRDAVTFRGRLLAISPESDYPARCHVVGATRASDSRRCS